ncbi:hypothetical protein [Streptomyces sp. ODS28]|uniref:hypothetical protein n=1 Tax=Streptomyces sp. ODS28 TaxID=3136688 RepID=UPI0031EED6F8
MPAHPTWRIHHVPAKPVRRSPDGITIPLWLLQNDTHHCDLDLSLTPAQAELLHAQLCRALATAWEPGPACRA